MQLQAKASSAAGHHLKVETECLDTGKETSHTVKASIVQEGSTSMASQHISHPVAQNPSPGLKH